MTADLSALIARLEAAEVGSRELDHLIFIHTAPMEVSSHWSPNDRMTLYTTSLDAALALAERVLPGWYVGVQPWFHTDPDRVMSRAYLIRPDWKRWNPVGDDWCDQHHGRSCATQALAVVIATLRAKQGEG